MPTQILSRSERRMEKKQAVFLLVLILAVSLVSFVLGVMVGRGSKTPPPVQASAPERLPVARGGTSEANGTAPAQPSAGNEHLTFYDALPKGEAPPLGSGINLPPEEAAPKPPPAVTSPPAAPQAGSPSAMASVPPPVAAAPSDRGNAEAREAEARKAEAAARQMEARKAEAARRAERARQAEPRKTEVAREPEPAPQATAPAGRFIIQVASFPSALEAEKMRSRLAARGFGASIEQADLGSKGTWHRVVVGPYDSDQSAAMAAARLKSQESVSALVRRR